MVRAGRHSEIEGHRRGRDLRLQSLCPDGGRGAGEKVFRLLPLPGRRHPMSDKRPFDIAVAFRRLRKAVHDLPKAAMFQLAEEGYNSVFELLVACLISIRTRDETTLPVSR